MNETIAIFIPEQEIFNAKDSFGMDLLIEKKLDEAKAKYITSYWNYSNMSCT